MDLKVIPITGIRENPVALRAVNRESEEYQGLVASIREKGILNPISVRAKEDAESNEPYFELVDGLHRYSAAKDAGLTEIGVNIVSFNDAEVLEAQVMANIHKIETRPIEYSRQLLRMLANNPLMTEAELSNKLGKSPQWISGRLNLTKIANPVIQTLINEGKIGLANAYALAKLPVEEQDNFVDRAQTDAPDRFVPEVQARVKEIREAKRKGRDAEPQEFQPVAHLQKLGAIKAELEAGAVADALIAQTGVKTTKEAFILGIKWVLHLDPASVDDQKAKNEAQKAEKTEQKKKREAERASKKADTLKKKAAEAAKNAVAAEEATKAAK